MRDQQRYFEANRRLWDRWTRLHTDAEMYDVAGFKAGRESLNPVELEELGSVAGKNLLHLQCHFGLDTLSWARRGARVTGVDLSPEAITTARRLAAECGLAADFVAANLYELPTSLTGRFDIVFSSYGVLNWLPDLGAWARVIADCLLPGGIFYLVEFHPFPLMFDREPGRFAYPYFPSGDPLEIVQQGSYAAPDCEAQFTCFEWPYTLGGVVSALLSAGLTLEFLHEFDQVPYACLPFLEAVGDKRFILKKSAHEGSPAHPFPLLFSIRARKQH